MLSVVIPTLNAEATLAAALAPIIAKKTDVVVVDGGSSDGTVALADSLGARVIESDPGRGRQLHLGAQAARGEWLLFLHADTVLAEGWLGAARHFMLSEKALTRAGAYRLKFDDPSPEAQRVAALANWRSRVLGLPYGDQGLLISRVLYDHLGGYRALPLMEDVDFVRRIGSGFIGVLGCDAVTSAERYRQDGWIARPVRNLLCLGMYLFGYSPDQLLDLYHGKKRQ